MSDYKCNILCTRPLDESLIHQANSRKIRIDIVPFIKTAAITSKELTEQVQFLQSKNITVVFTSMNAVKAVAELLTTKPDWQIFSMGGITKELVIQYFGRSALKNSAKNATLLAEKIINEGDCKEITFFCGDQRLDDLPETLFKAGILVNEEIVYTTIETPVMVERTYQGIIFFSPSAVHSFFSLNTLPIDTVIFSIGKTTSAVSHSYCSNKIITSEWPGKEQLVHRALDFFTT